MKIWDCLELAGKVADRQYPDMRAHCLGAVGIRTDGACVTSKNGYGRERLLHAHAEARLLRKIDAGATVYVTRVRKSGEFGLARPCSSCLLGLLLKKVKRVYFTTDTASEYGCIDLEHLR